MAEKLQVYKCAVCGNVVEVLHAGAGELVCCGKPMNLMAENTTDAAREKHVPVMKRPPMVSWLRSAALPIPWRRSIILNLLN